MKKKLIGVTAFMLFLLSGCGNSPPSTSPSAIATTPPPSETQQEEDTRGILGSHITDIRMGMTQFGFEEPSIKSSPEDAKEIFAFSSSTLYENSDLDATLDYSLTADSEFQVIGGSFGISWQANGDNTHFIAAAQTYLGFASTMPYDDSDITAAKEWITNNIPSVADGDNLSKTIGDATFELYGTKTGDNYTSFILDISKAD